MGRYVKDEDFGNSPRCQEALDYAVKSVARVFGRENELEPFMRAREMILKGLNDPTTNSPMSYEEYKKSIPYWVTALEPSLYSLYEAGLSDKRTQEAIEHRKYIRRKRN